jgi:enoyl-CoA hydratase/carnithine racemase
MGAAATKHLMYSGDLIDATRALRIGLVDEVHSVDALEQRVHDYVEVLLMRSSLTQVASKAMIDEVVREGRVKPASTLHWETEMDRSGEVREGVAAFLAKRAPRWPWKRA